MLRFTIRSTAALLALGAVLVIVGTFDSFLGWDIFSPALESVLRGVFFSAIALAAVGIALCFVLGIQEITDLLRASLAGEPAPARRGTSHYALRAAAGVAALTLLVGALEIVDRRVQVERRAEFKRLADREAAQLAPKLTRELPVENPPVPSERLALLIDTLDDTDFVGDATLYLADPTDRDVLWRYQPGWVQRPPHFERLFVSRSSERAVRKTLDGEDGHLATENAKPHFAWLAVVPADGRPAGVLRITADESKSFRSGGGAD
jgi:hypothetical protein